MATVKLLKKLKKINIFKTLSFALLLLSLFSFAHTDFALNSIRYGAPVSGIKKSRNVFKNYFEHFCVILIVYLFFFSLFSSSSNFALILISSINGDRGGGGAVCAGCRHWDGLAFFFQVLEGLVHGFLQKNGLPLQNIVMNPIYNFGSCRSKWTLSVK